MKIKYKKGDHRMFCQACSKNILYSQAKLRWDRVWACKGCWEPKQPHLDPPPPRFDGRAVLIAQPEPEDVFLEVGDVTEDDF